MSLDETLVGSQPGHDSDHAALRAEAATRGVTIAQLTAGVSTLADHASVHQALHANHNLIGAVTVLPETNLAGGHLAHHQALHAAYNLRTGSGTSAPTGPFTLGVEVGVPTGTTLTNTSGIPTPDATENITLTHPISGVQQVLSCAVFRRRRWTSTPFFNAGAGVHYYFDECEFSISDDNSCADLNNNNAVNNQMLPQYIFNRCTFNGNNTTGRCLVEGYAWMRSCHVGNAEDGWSGPVYSVIQDSNFICTTDGQIDPHADCIQINGLGSLTVYHCWLDAGSNAANANAALRIGTEGSAVTNCQMYYCGLKTAGGSDLQVRGDAGAGDITNVDFQHNRWTRDQTSDPADFQETTGITWVDNAYFDGEVINP
jgi:hypothetical protein